VDARGAPLFPHSRIRRALRQALLSVAVGPNDEGARRAASASTSFGGRQGATSGYVDGPVPPETPRRPGYNALPVEDRAGAGAGSLRGLELPTPSKLPR
jgi:hypothetical protein